MVPSLIQIILYISPDLNHSMSLCHYTGTSFCFWHDILTVMGESVCKDTWFFYRFRLSMEHHEWVNISDSRHCEAWFYFKLWLGCEKPILTAGAQSSLSRIEPRNSRLRSQSFNTELNLSSSSSSNGPENLTDDSNQFSQCYKTFYVF